MNDTHDSDHPFSGADRDTGANGAGVSETPLWGVPSDFDTAHGRPDSNPANNDALIAGEAQSSRRVMHGQSAVADDEEDAEDAEYNERTGYAEHTEFDAQTFDTGGTESSDNAAFGIPAFDTQAQHAGVTVPRGAPFKPPPQEDFASPPPPNGRGPGGKSAPSASVPPVPPVPYEPAPEAEMDLLEHLGELRTRLLRCICAVTLIMIVTWTIRDQLLAWFAKPIVSVLKEYPGYQLITVSPGEGFMIYMQITFAAALLLTAPYVLWEIWGFVEPALTRQERRYTSVLVPFSITLFVVGCLAGYFMTPVFFRFFLGFQPPGSVANYSYGIAVTLLAKMLLVFGVCFQVPVITIFVNKTGLVSRNLLIEYWRHVVVVIFIVVAIITPTWDPLTLFAAAVPPCLLYVISLWMVKWL
jgi:sec-independent protein translocase protein TatC